MGDVHFGRAGAVLLAPALILAAAVIAVAKSADLPPPALAAFDNAPYVLAALGALFGGWFKRSRIVFSLSLVVIGFAVIGLFPAPPGAEPMGQVAYAALALLLPVNLALFSVLDERGVASRRGLARIGLIAGQVVAVALVVDGGPLGPAAVKSVHDAVAAALHLRLLPPSMDAWTFLPQPALLAMGLLIVVFLARVIRHPTPLDGGTVGAMAAVAMGLHRVGHGAAPGIFFTAAALILVAALALDAYRMAFHDELTGLPGRRAMTVAMKKLGGRYVIAMVDVDHFKKFNDTYGHDVGDQVLQMVAARISRVAGGGSAFRYGGEEFAVLFPGNDMDDAWEHLERLCWAVADSEFRLRQKDQPRRKSGHRPSRKPRRRPGRKLPPELKSKRFSRPAAHKVGVTVSIGVAERSAGETPDAVLKAADQALYRAKKAGRNRLSD